jgi:hypothetical protein
MFHEWLQELKARWQRWLDKLVETDARHRAVVTQTTRRAMTRLGYTDPYEQLAPAQLEVDHGYSTRELPVVQTALPVLRRRDYEDLYQPEWVSWALAVMDARMWRPIEEMRRFEDRVFGRYVKPHEWETPQYRHRHVENLLEATDDARLMRELDEAKVIEVAERILVRAYRASSLEVPGLVPTLPTALVEEEAWA